MVKRSQREGRDAKKRAHDAPAEANKQIIYTKEELQKQVTQMTPADVAAKLRYLPEGDHYIQSIGACPAIFSPSFHYACTTDGQIWRINECNHDWVENMVCLAHGPFKIKPFPCQARVRQDGKIYVANDCHIDTERDEQVRSDTVYSKQVGQKWQHTDVQLEECFVCKKRFVCDCGKQQQEKPKYRSCAMRDGYPQSRLHSDSEGCFLIHICSELCDNQYEDPAITRFKALGMKSITVGEYTQWYDPNHKTETEAMEELRRNLFV